MLGDWAWYFIASKLWLYFSNKKLSKYFRTKCGRGKLAEKANWTDIKIMPTDRVFRERLALPKEIRSI